MRTLVELVWEVCSYGGRLCPIDEKKGVCQNPRIETKPSSCHDALMDMIAIWHWKNMIVVYCMCTWGLAYL